MDKGGPEYFSTRCESLNQVPQHVSNIKFFDKCLVDNTFLSD